MIKTLVAFTIVLSIIGISISTSYCEHYWAKTYGMGSDDSASCVTKTTDGGYLVGGETASFGAGEDDIWLMKIDSGGEVNWQKTYGGTLEETNSFDYSMLEVTDGNFIITGSTSSFGAGNTDAWILKLDSSGNVIWQKTYGGDGSDNVNSIQQTTDGGYITVGSTSSFGDGSSDICVMKLHSNGNIMWQKTYGGEGYISAQSIQETSDGGYIVVGSTSLSGDEWGDIFALKLTSIGDISWSKAFGVCCGDFGEFAHEVLGEGYIVGGTNYHEGYYYYWLLKLDYSGNITWQKMYGIYEAANHAFSFHQTADGGYVIAGSSLVFSPSVNDFALVVQLDGNGDVLWHKTYDVGEYTTIMSIQQTVAGGYIMVGHAGLEPPGNQDVLILQLDNTGNIPDCNLISNKYFIFSETTVSPEDFSFTVQTSIPTITDTTIVPQDFSTVISDICCYDDTSDADQDGIGDVCDPDDDNDGVCDPGVSDSICTGSDNCPYTPNGSEGGTCTAGATYKIGRPCINHAECEASGFCSTNQEDTYPPGGDGIGDACFLCESDFDCDGDCDGTDTAAFKLDFGRSTFANPCNNESQCNGDYDCDVDVDGTDTALFKSDFGRSSFNNPCPVCEVGDWCSYQ